MVVATGKGGTLSLPWITIGLRAVGWMNMVLWNIDEEAGK